MQINNEIISVLLPTYNRQLYIKEAIDSILNQTYQNIHLIIYDDGSTDNTESIVRSIQDKRLTYYRNTINKGVSVARNILLDLCNTKYAVWQDSDDISNMYRIELQYKQIQHSCSMLRSSSDILSSETNVLKTMFPQKNITKMVVPATSFFFVDKTIRFDLRLCRAEDSVWGQEMRKKYSLHTLSKILYYVRIHPNRLSTIHASFDYKKALKNE